MSGAGGEAAISGSGMAGFLGGYRRFNDVLAGAIIAVASALIALIVIAPFAAAVTRYVTGQGYDWLAELPPQLVPWVVFPLAGVLLRNERHIAVEVLPHFLAARPLNVLRILLMAISFAGCLVFAVFGVSAVQFFAQLGQLSTTEIEFPLWWLYVSYPVGFFLAANFCLESILRLMLADVPAEARPDAAAHGVLQ
jgi:TRAP-type C4-dicarboxylate transport system permease small subunit